MIALTLALLLAAPTKPDGAAPPAAKQLPAIIVPMDGPRDPNDQRQALLQCNHGRNLKVSGCKVIQSKPEEFGPIAIKRAEALEAVPMKTPDGMPLGAKIMVVVTGTGVARQAPPPTAP